MDNKGLTPLSILALIDNKGLTLLLILAWTTRCYQILDLQFTPIEKYFL